MNTRSIETFGPDVEFFTARGATFYRWDKHLANKQGMWSVICHNNELAYMQGVTPGNVHIDCVVDDFGSLVRVVQ